MADAKQELFNQTLSFGQRAWRWIVLHQRQLKWGLIFACAFVSLWQLHRTFTHRKVILYTGDHTSDSYRHGETIREYFSKTHSSFFASYDIEVATSEGLTENRRRVMLPNDALVLGFDQDGFNPPPDVRTLIPLTDVTLHVLIRKPEPKQMDAMFIFGADITAYVPNRHGSLSEVLKTIPNYKQTLRCYLGPKGSGTRQIATHVLGHYGIAAKHVDVGGHIGWDAAYRMLRNRELDVLFEGSEMGSSGIGDLARENLFQLVGLDNVDGIVQGQQNFMKQTINEGLYNLGTEFCKGKIETVATHRIIICPASLSSFDGYYLSQGIQEALRHHVPQIPWEQKKPTQTTTTRVIPLHPGAEQVKNEASAPYILFWKAVSSHWQWGFPIMLTFFTLLSNWRKAAPPPPASEPVATPPAPVAVAPPTPPTTVPNAAVPKPVRNVQADADDLALRLASPLDDKAYRQLGRDLAEFQRDLHEARQAYEAAFPAIFSALLTQLGRLRLDYDAAKPAPPPANSAGSGPASSGP